MGFLAKVVLNLLRSLFLFNRATEKNTDSCTKAMGIIYLTKQEPICLMLRVFFVLILLIASYILSTLFL